MVKSSIPDTDIKEEMVLGGLVMTVSEGMNDWW